MTAPNIQGTQWASDRVKNYGGFTALQTGVVAIGATGAVGTITCPGGMKPGIVRDSAGKYTFTFPVGSHATFFDAKVFGDAGHANNIHVTRVIDYSDANGTIQVQCSVFSEAADALVETATDPTNGAEIRFMYVVTDGEP